jgi:hypothetical protein
MANDWTKLLQRALGHALNTLHDRRGASAEAGRPFVTQVKADFSNVPDWHHSQHHGDWLTVVDTETRVGTRYVCLCPEGFAVWVDAENVRGTRRVPEPAARRPGADPDFTRCDKGRW